jgi:glucose-1-phosphate cytidylyltransferase
MKAMILCGGQGLRLKGNFGDTPKPLVPVQGMPILSYIIQHYHGYGVSEFLLLVGDNKSCFERFKKQYDRTDIVIDVLQTGSQTPTGGRLMKGLSALKGENRVLMTYGDGLANVDVDALLAKHQDLGKLVTLTAIQPQLPFGMIAFDTNDVVTSFVEKPRMEQFISGGFFVVERAILERLSEDSDFENEILPALAANGDLCAYVHTGFWKSMDTYKDYCQLNQADLSVLARMEV